MVRACRRDRPAAAPLDRPAEARPVHPEARRSQILALALARQTLQSRILALALARQTLRRQPAAQVSRTMVPVSAALHRRAVARRPSRRLRVARTAPAHLRPARPRLLAPPRLAHLAPQHEKAKTPPRRIRRRRASMPFPPDSVSAARKTSEPSRSSSR